MKLRLVLIALFFVMYTSPSFGLQIGLRSGEVLDAQSIDLPSEFEITLKDGSTKKIKKEDIQSIELQKNTSIRPLLKKDNKLSDTELEKVLDEFRDLKPYETPKQTFLTWREAAKNGSIEDMVNCYADFRQPEVRKDLKDIKKKDREKMSESMHIMSFATDEPVYQGKQAFMEVTWNKGLYSENQVLTFILQGNEWKIVK